MKRNAIFKIHIPCDNSNWARTGLVPFLPNFAFTNYLRLSHFRLICERYPMGDRLGDAKKGEAERGCKYPSQVFYKSAPLFGGSKLYSPPDPFEIETRVRWDAQARRFTVCSPLLGGSVMNGCRYAKIKMRLCESQSHFYFCYNLLAIQLQEPINA